MRVIFSSKYLKLNVNFRSSTKIYVNTFSAYDKYFLRNSQNLPQQIQMQISKKQKTHSEFTFNFKFFEKKKKIIIVYVFPKLQTAKSVVRQMSKKPRFGTPFDS